MQQVLFDWLDGQCERVVTLQRHLTALPALAPENGGTGEMRKAEYIMQQLAALGLVEIRRMDAVDSRVPEGLRPNMAVRIQGTSPRTLWIMAHMDVVPPGKMSLWKADPWTLQVDGDVLTGRGVEDNQQAIVAMLLLAEGLHTNKLVPDVSLGLLFVADEECGNQYGIQHVMRNHMDLFGKDDMVLVPDIGNEQGTLLDVAEKGILWLKATLKGKQCHASTPHEGINTLVAAAEMILATSQVAARFNQQNALFSPPVSTFTPTRYEENVPNVNTVSGCDVFYVDCRVLPGTTHDQVLAAFHDIYSVVAAKHGVELHLDVVQDNPAAPITPKESDVVVRLSASVRRVLGVEPCLSGVGGGTVAAEFRRAGFMAVGWATLGNSIHQVNENSRISRAIADSKVFADMLFG